MDKALKRAQTKITAITVAVALGCAALTTIGMFALTENRLQEKITAKQIGTLAEVNPELSAYLAAEEPNHAHFETIATLIQQDERRQITTGLPLLLGGTFLFSSLIAWLAARWLLKPVKESYVSQRRFMQDAAHELRNPLAAMKTMIQQASKRPSKNQDYQKILTSIDRQADHLSAITTDLLLLERREFPGQDATDISQLLDEILEELLYQTKINQINVSKQIPEKLITNIDPQHFIYIAKNLIENAIKFSKPKKTVTVKLVPGKSGWELVVKDQGIGIPKDELENISQRFYRAKNASKIDGTGLGMAIVHKFVNIYKGELNIQSSPKTGTTVSVKI